MKTMSHFLITTLAGALLLTGACSSSNSSTGTGGTSGTDGGGGAGADHLVSSATGFVDDVTTGVVGAWYAYGDSAGPNANATSTDFSNSHCQMGGFTADQCTIIVAPTPGQPFPPTDMATSQMCTNGTAAKVINKSGASTP